MKTENCDVLVVGGGPAGVCAAVSAARTGAKTVLLERTGVLGGMMTTGLVQPLLGSCASYTMYQEVCGLLMQGHDPTQCRTTRNGTEIPIDPEEAKLRLLKLALDSGVQVHLQTAVAEVLMQEDTVVGVLAADGMGLNEYRAAVAVDASGDGFVAWRAGVPYEVGRAEDGMCQPATIEFTLAGVSEYEAITCFGGSDPVQLSDGTPYVQLCKEASERGELPENVQIVRVHPTWRIGERQVNATQKNGGNLFDAAELAKADLELRMQISKIVFFLRKHVPGYAHCYVKASANMVGVRESRRFEGLYRLTDADVEEGRHFDDAVVHNAWFLIDIHNPAGGGQAEGHSRMARPYDIPIRCLIPQKVNGLLLSGRNISGTHRAHASYRVMGIAMAVGQAAGTAAALCVREKICPAALDVRLVQRELEAAGAVLKE